MRRPLRALALPAIAAIMLAGCGGTDDATEPINAGAQQEAPASDGGAAPMNDGSDDADDNESDAWPEVDDGTPSGPFSPEGAVGGTLDGSVYTLGAVEPIPDDITELMTDAGYLEKDMESLRVIPVHIDNSKGTATESIYSATAVTEGGEQYALDTLGNFLRDVADGMEGGGMGDPVYDALWDRGEEELKDVAPTAQATVYLLLEGIEDPENVKFTYFEIQPPEWGDPIPMAPID